MDAKFNFAAIFLAGFSLLAQASTNSDADLDDAARFVREREKSKAVAQSMLAPKPLQAVLLQERFYAPGDTWVVAVIHFEHGQVQKSENAGESRAFETAPSFLAFKVESVEVAKATVLVIDANADGMPLAGAKSRKMALVFHGQQGRAQALGMSLPKTELVGGGFDGFPLRLPPLKSTQMRAQGSGITFTAHDYLSRKVTVQWNAGDLWPASVECAAGRAVLVKQERAQ